MAAAIQERRRVWTVNVVNEEANRIEIVDLPAHLRAGDDSDGSQWSITSADLNVNLVRFDRGRGVPKHVNGEVDVLIAVIEGEGVLTVEGIERSIRAGQLCLIPKGTARSIRSAGASFAYLTCHRSRGGIWPS